MFSRPEVKAVSQSSLKYLSAALFLSTDKIFLKQHFLKYPQMVTNYVEVLKVKGLGGRREATFLPSLVQDFVKALKAYPVDAVIEEEIADKDDL